MRAGVELPVRKGPSAALAELHVVFRVQRAPGAEGFHRPAPGLHILPALQYHRPQAGAGQHQRREHPRRAEANDDGLFSPDRRAGEIRDLINQRAVFQHVRIFAAPQDFRLVPPDFDSYGADPADLRLTSGVQRAFFQHAFRDLFRRDAELPRCKLRQALRCQSKIFLRRQAEISYQDHAPSLPARAPLAQAHCRL